MVRSFKWITLLLALAASLSAQEKRSRIEVQNYTVDAEINPRTQSIVATAKIDFTALEAANDASFELNNALNVSKAVDQHGSPLTTTRNTQEFSVKIAFPGSLQKSQHYQISLAYDGKLTGDGDSPVYGIRFAALHPDFGFLLYPARWFPVRTAPRSRWTGTARAGPTRRRPART